jgi:tricorn protease
VPVTIENDMINSRDELKDASKSIASASLSPAGERVLFSARGELFSLPASKGITMNLTRTSQVHDREGDWSPNGKYIAWISDQSGESEIWIQSANGEDKPRQLTTGSDTYKFNLAWSPDSRYIAWNDQHYRLMLSETATGQTRELASSKYSRLADFSWSPDSKWLTFSDGNANDMSTIQLLNLESGKRFEITQSWYNSDHPVFSADGKYLLFVSARDFNPTYSNTEWNHAYINTYRVYMALLSKDTPSPFAPENPDVKAIEEAAESEKEKAKKEKKKEEEKPAVEPVKIDLEGIQNRIISLPIEPAYYYHLSCVEGTVYYNRRFQGGKEGNGLMAYNLKTQKETLLGDFNYTLSANQKKMLVGKNNKWQVIDLPGAALKVEEPMDLSNMKVFVNYAGEWQQIFNEAWRQMRDFFYVENMHGVDWPAIREKYAQLVPHVQHRTDLGYVIGEMIGELNIGHAYVNSGEQPEASRLKTGLLGAQLLSDPSGYFKIEKILEGAPWSKPLASPLRAPGVNVKSGEYIVAVDKIPTNSTTDFYSLLPGKAEQVVELQVNDKPSMQGARKVLVEPIDDESALYYYAWVSDNLAKVSQATNGEVGYIHIPDMGPEGLNQFVKYFYPQLDKKALIIDDRGNGGGNVSPMILERLSREAYRFNMRRNSPVVTPVPSETMVGPMVTLIDKYSASDGDLFPYGFRALGLGKLIGTRSWGGIVGITGSLPFIDGTQLRIPQFTSLSVDGNWMIEGKGVTPDIEVENDPYKEFMGEDAQLNKAIEVIMKEMEDRKPIPEIPAPPVK